MASLFSFFTLSAALFVSAYAQANQPFTVVYEQVPLSGSQVQELEELLSRPVLQYPLNKDDSASQSMLRHQADLALVSDSKARELVSNDAAFAPIDIDWDKPKWQYVDINSADDKAFFPLLVDFTSLAINADMLPQTLVRSWADAWDSQWSEQIAVSDDYRKLFVIALDSLGYATDTTNPTEIHSAFKLLQQWLPNIREISPADDIEMAFLSGEIVLGTATNTSAYMLSQEGSPIQMLWEMEPIVRTTYGAAVPATTKDINDSTAAIAWLTSPIQAAEYAFSNKRVSALIQTNSVLPAEYVGDKNLYPPTELSYFHYSEFIGNSSLYQDYFDQLCNELKKSRY